MNCIGIDLHKQYFVAIVIDQEGKVISKNRVSTDRTAIKDYFRKVEGDGALKVVIELLEPELSF